MFKSDPVIKAFSNIKTSERRRIFVIICQDFNIPKDRITLECERAILPAVIKSGTFKAATGASGTIYTDEAGVPLWFKTKDSSFIPTVYTLWKCPGILPMIYTHDAVVERLMAGANLMLPGTLPPFDPDLKNGRLCAIGNINSPDVAVAVGYCALDLTGITRVIGLTGVVVKSVHYIDDELFKMPRHPPTIPAAGSVSRELELKPEGEVSGPVQEDEEEENDGDEDGNAHISVDDASATSEGGELEDDEEEAEIGEERDQEEEEEQQEEEEQRPVEEEEEEESNENVDEINDLVEDTYQLTIEDIDEFFIRSLLQSITQDKIEVPITLSNFMGNHILKNLPQVDAKVVNMKKTSWKKSAKFLKAMEKLQLLKVKGKGDDLTVTSLATKDHERVRKFEPYKIKRATSSSPAGSNSKEGLNSNQLQAIQYFKPVSAVKNLLREIDVNPDGYYTGHQVKEILNKYISLKKLVNAKNKKQLYINDTIKPIVVSNKELKGLVPGVAIYLDRVQVAETFVKNGFSIYYSIVQPGEDASKAKILRGEVPKITIIEELRIGRKVVTRVFGFEGFGIRADDLSDELRIKCSGSTTVGNNVQNPKFVEVMVQGPHFKTVSDVLIKKGIKPTWITHENKLKPKKKRTVR